MSERRSCKEEGGGKRKNDFHTITPFFSSNTQFLYCGSDGGGGGGECRHIFILWVTCAHQSKVYLCVCSLYFLRIRVHIFITVIIICIYFAI